MSLLVCVAVKMKDLKIKMCRFYRLWAVMLKEFIQMRRDPLTFGILVAIPLMQLILFGYAINTNPKHMPTTVIAADHSPFTRAFIAGLKNTDYFTITTQAKSEREANQMLANGKVQFVANIPANFTKELIRGKRPQISIEADATDPVASGSALSAVPVVAANAFSHLIVGPLGYLQMQPSAMTNSLNRADYRPDPNLQVPLVRVVSHAKYNPESITSYNIVPGLLGVVLTMTMILVTGLALTREREVGTMENLLATPVSPIEVMIGKVLPYIIVGYIQVSLILTAAFALFHVPMLGNLFLLLIGTFPFIAANLTVGIMFSSIAKNQLQAVQLTFFFFLPSILLSGFMFPFRGMPTWAQYVGTCLPLTHYLRVVRGIVLKGNSLTMVLPHIWPMLLFMLVVIAIGAKVYRRTLD